MQLIGTGYYYDVYSIGDDRVIKKETSHLHRIKKLLNWRGNDIFSQAKIIFAYPKQTLSDARTLQASRKVASLDSEMFGNPEFINNTEYIQDKAVPLEQYFQHHTLHKNKKVFNAYPSLVKKLWLHGYSDTVFNFTINTGVSVKTSELIFFDFNGLSQSEGKVKRCIRDKKWLTQKSLRDMEESSLKKHIVKVLDEELTVERFKNIWRKAVQD